MIRKYPVVFEFAGTNFGGYAPDIPGCIATAKTIEQVREQLKSALEAHLQWMENDGDPIPEASAKVTVDLTPHPQFRQPRGYYAIVEQLGISLPRKKKTTSRKTPHRHLSAA